MKVTKVFFLVVTLASLLFLASCSTEKQDSSIEAFFGPPEKLSWNDPYWKKIVEGYEQRGKDSLVNLFVVNYPFDKKGGDDLIVLFRNELVFRSSEGGVRLPKNFTQGMEISYNVGIVRERRIYLGYVKTTFAFDSTSKSYYLSFYPDKIDTEESFLIVPTNIEIH